MPARHMRVRANKNRLLAGASQKKITPSAVGPFLVGPEKASTGIHDELFARALVLDDGRERLVILTLDLIGLDLDFADALRARIGNETGVPVRHIMLNCSHTHSAPFTIPWNMSKTEMFGGCLRVWRKELLNKVSETVNLAISCLQEAELCFGRQRVQVGFNRRLLTRNGVVMRTDRKGAIVPWVDVLGAYNNKKKPIAILFSHAAHPVIIHGRSTLISADYPGYAVASINKYFDKHAIIMFAQGCGGNINGEPLRGGFLKARKAGGMLGDAVLKALRRSKPITVDRVYGLTHKMKLPLRKPPDVETCKKMIGMIEAENKDLPANWHRQKLLAGWRDLLAMAKRKKPRYLSHEIQSFALGGEFCITAMTHEPFAEYQLETNNMSPFKYNMVLGYTNGCESYIPCKKDFVLGGYEGAVLPRLGAAFYYCGRTALSSQVEKKVKTGISQVLRRIKMETSSSTACTGVKR